MLPFEFHISKRARDQFQFDQGLFSTDGRLTLADLAAARKFADQMSRMKSEPIPVEDIIALGLIDEIQHILIRHYEQENNKTMNSAYQWLNNELGNKNLFKCQLDFLDSFPPTVVYQVNTSPVEYLSKSKTPGLVLEEMLLLHITNLNPATGRYLELFNETDLMKSQEYQKVIERITHFFEMKPEGKTDGNRETLIDLLLAPARISPHSLKAQLEFLLHRWGNILGERFINKILRTLDLMIEADRRQPGTGGSDDQVPVQEFDQVNREDENYSPDKDWMPELILMAKNSYVWLDQLSKKYQRAIQTLDQIPDEELDLLEKSGFTGLWLIGLWERSNASLRIKQTLGKQDAVASAYSLMDYQIAQKLGGWDALKNLREHAWRRGIRLSADMVPNHMGIDSTWVIEHPDWFLSLPNSPFPGYSFNGTELSENQRVGIFLEDHYYDKTDAAVVFKRVDNETGDVRYIYHGNDGTSMPWNDTAQLNYLKAEVREAVIQTILHVARNFPIIRFDAAMTLANKHIQRLWFPQPGEGGAIPSRSEHGLSRAQFRSLMPKEFWREVVDRVANEVPNTLLLAEAFWLMEGFFVRTLGMHRVYNSAFMHMLRNEDNAKYRQVIKNVLEFDPQILKRYVNFMNNPDEKTAVEQFGEGDKYLGICTLLATLPGLPMFGHGQIEGFHEKYGMEYQRAYWDEMPNEGLKRAHEWHIFPLLKRRHLFADVENFRLFDFFTENGEVNEDVFAYSNGFGEGLDSGSSERILIIYHNKYAETRGWIRTSVAYLDKTSGKLVQTTLGEAMGLRGGSDNYTVFRDLENGLEFIHPSIGLVQDGLYFELKAYQHHSFIEFREVKDDEGRWKQVCDDLNGNGYWSIQARMDEINSHLVEVTEAKEPIKKKRALKSEKTNLNRETLKKQTRKKPAN
jgi:glycosidase